MSNDQQGEEKRYRVGKETGFTEHWAVKDHHGTSRYGNLVAVFLREGSVNYQQLAQDLADTLNEQHEEQVRTRQARYTLTNHINNLPDGEARYLAHQLAQEGAKITVDTKGVSE
ncbi:hypothetical protein DM785_02550 [Deinococcus actinosclerus]|nr:hypothetical protein DM785_02550 [Deinococcus actinosclerus]